MELGFQFLEHKDSFVLDKDFSIFSKEHSGEPADGEIKNAISSIVSAAKNSADLPSCIAAINAIKKYLSHESSKVRNVACEVMSSLIGKAAIFLCSETDPKKIMAVARFLIETIGELQSMDKGGSINLGTSSMLNLDFAKKTIGDVIRKLCSSSQDEFISSKNKNDSLSKQENNCDIDQFISSKKIA